MEVIEAVKTRRSIRKYRPNPIAEETILGILEAANLAPTAGNVQPWRFIVLYREALDSFGEIIKKGIEARMEDIGEDKMLERLKNLPVPTDESGNKIQGLKEFFRRFGQAPVAIVAYAEKPEDAWAYKNVIEDVSAAFENLVLAAWDQGLGTCWMTGPLQKGTDEIKKFLGLGENEEIIAMTPLGIPAELPLSPPKEGIQTRIRKIEFNKSKS